MLAEQNDEWTVACRYMSRDSLRADQPAALPSVQQPQDEDVLLAKTA